MWVLPIEESTMKHVLSDWDLIPEQVTQILHISEKIKSKPSLYKHTMEGKTLIMLFELASLRTRISFEAGMTQLGGHAIMYGVENQGFSRSGKPKHREERFRYILQWFDKHLSQPSYSI